MCLLLVPVLVPMLSEVEVEVEVVPVLVVAAELPVEAGFEVLVAAKAAVDAVSERANRDEKRVLEIIGRSIARVVGTSPRCAERRLSVPTFREY